MTTTYEPMMYMIPQIKFLIFGGAGSLGRTLTSRIIQKWPLAKVVIFSRDEAKHFHMRNLFSAETRIQYHIGDVRDYASVVDAIRKYQPSHIINAAALKQVPLCEEYPTEAVKTNIIGTDNIVRAAHSVAHFANKLNILSISTDKAVKPVNAYGATKMLQEKIHLNANHGYVTCNVVRYGNVLESTGSVIPFFKNLLSLNAQLPVTDEQMTRFLLSLDEAVDLIFTALDSAHGGKVFLPHIRSARIIDLAEILCEMEGKEPSKTISIVGKRPGEKLHEILASEEECSRAILVDNHFEIGDKVHFAGHTEYGFSSECNLLNQIELFDFLAEKGVIGCKSESQAQQASSAAI